MLKKKILVTLLVKMNVMRLLDLEPFESLCILVASGIKLSVYRLFVKLHVLCEVYAIKLSAVKVTRRDTNVWKKEENQLVSKKEQCSVPDVLMV